MTLRRVNRRYGRVYINEDGVEYPSVTTVLNVLEKPLLKWAQDLQGDYTIRELKRALAGERLLNLEEIVDEAKAYPIKVRNEKGERGTMIHKQIERMLKGEDVTAERRRDFQLNAVLQHVENWLLEYRVEPVLAEAYLYSDTYRYAGTVDLVAYLNKENKPRTLAVVDFKSSKGVYDTHRWQLAAYMHAYHEMYGERPHIGFIIHIDYDNCVVSEEMHIHDDDQHKYEVDVEFSTFLHVLEAFRARYMRQDR